MTQASKVTTRFPIESDLRADRVGRLSDLINEVYDDAESGMWRRKGVRTNPAEVERFLRARALILAEIDGVLVGSVNVNLMSDGVGEFGMLVADRKYRGEGIGSALVEHAERWAREHACHTMRLEVLSPRHWTHPSKEFLRQWYSRIGYTPQATEPFEAMHSELVPELATECNFTVWHKSLGGHAAVNGIQIYYELHGRRDGLPLVLLHGGGSTIEITFSKVLPVFAGSRRVIAVEEQGHGRTTDRDAPVTFESSADDVAGLLRYLKVGKADVFGFSNGASIALQVAIRHPRLVRKMVFASSFTRRDGAQPQLWEFMRQADFSNMPQPLKDAFLRVNPDSQKLKTMHDKDAARMRSFQDVPNELVKSVGSPTLVVVGDRDIVRLEHAVELTRLIAGARLLILPGGHGDYLGEAVMTQKDTRYPELTARLIEEFLDAP